MHRSTKLSNPPGTSNQPVAATRHQQTLTVANSHTDRTSISTTTTTVSTMFATYHNLLHQTPTQTILGFLPQPHFQLLSSLHGRNFPNSWQGVITIELDSTASSLPWIIEPANQHGRIYAIYYWITIGRIIELQLDFMPCSCFSMNDLKPTRTQFYRHYSSFSSEMFIWWTWVTLTTWIIQSLKQLVGCLSLVASGTKQILKILFVVSAVLAKTQGCVWRHLFRQVSAQIEILSYLVP